MPEYRSGEPLQVSYVEPLDDTEVLRLGMGFTGGAVELTSDTVGASSYPALLTADFGDRPARVIREGSRRFRDIYLSTDVHGPVVKFERDDGYVWDSPGPDSREFEFSLEVSRLVDWKPDGLT